MQHIAIVSDDGRIEDVTGLVETILGSMDQWGSDWEAWVPDETVAAIYGIASKLHPDDYGDKLQRVLRERAETAERLRKIQEQRTREREERERRRVAYEARRAEALTELSQQFLELGERHAAKPGVIFANLVVD